MSPRFISKVEEIEHHGLIFLVGVSGSGKSTLAKKWANRLGLDHYDLDQIIEINEGKSISEIFERQGESEFRRIEQSYLRSISTGMLACGGGTPLFHDNMDWMLSQGTVVWIKLTPEMAWSRVSHSDHRPLVKLGKENFIETMKSREICYSRANFVFQP
jgi:shikimate kinase